MPAPLMPWPMPWRDEEIFSLAAGSQVNDRKSHQGVTGKKAGLHQRSTACNSTTALGVSWRLWSRTMPEATVTYEYDAYGNKINSTGTTPNNFLYRGEAYDNDLSLYYLRARWMNPLTGRFMSRDPERENGYDPKTLHRYLYAGADPVNRIDPRGRAPGGEDELEEGELTEEVGELGEKLEEEKLPEAFANKFTDVDDAFEQLESLEDDQSYQDPGYNPSSKKSLDALINAAKKFFNP